MDHLTIRESARTDLYMADGLFVIVQNKQRVSLTRAQAKIVRDKLDEAINDGQVWEPGQ